MNSEPLLFIDSINIKEVIPKNQDIYDSRYNINKKIITKSHDTEFYIKLSRLVLMHNKNKRIVCKVLMLSKEEYYVIVTSSINNILTCININDNKKIEFNINEIDELTIEEIH